MTFSLLIEFLVIVGLMTAVVVGWTVYRSPGNWKKILPWILVFLTFDLVVFGAFTRLTDSGLGCPDWPGCYAQSTPWHAKFQIHQEMQVSPTGPVTHTKAWIEMIHRYLAMTVGLLTISMVFLSFREKAGRFLIVFSLYLLALVCLQGAFGAWTVTMKLQPIIVTGHLFLGVLFLVSVFSFAMKWTLRYDNTTFRLNSKSWFYRPLPGHFSLLAMGLLIILFLQLILGGWVSSNYAVMACTGFPTCNGAWLPNMNLDQAFTLWRPLGQLRTGEPISPEALTAIHFVHRVFAVIVTIFTVYFAWKLRTFCRRSSLILIGLLGIQLLSGIGNVVLGWPLVVAILHSAGASLLILTVSQVYWRSKI